MRICRACQTPQEHYYRQARSPDGLDTICRECRRTWARERATRLPSRGRAAFATFQRRQPQPPPVLVDPNKYLYRRPAGLPSVISPWDDPVRRFR